MGDKEGNEKDKFIIRKIQPILGCGAYRTLFIQKSKNYVFLTLQKTSYVLHHLLIN